jgi:hypothetical protein
LIIRTGLVLDVFNVHALSSFLVISSLAASHFLPPHVYESLGRKRPFPFSEQGTISLLPPVTLYNVLFNLQHI